MVAGAPDGASVDGRTAVSGNFVEKSTELWINAHTPVRPWQSRACAQRSVPVSLVAPLLAQRGFCVCPPLGLWLGLGFSLGLGFGLRRDDLGRGVFCGERLVELGVILGGGLVLCALGRLHCLELL